jgi:NACHT NTPase-like protein
MGPTDAMSQSQQWPQAASNSLGSEQPETSSDPTAPNWRSHPETEHRGPSFGSSYFNNPGVGPQFNAGVTQNNNTGSGNQFPWATFNRPIIGNVINRKSVLMLS